MEADPSIVHEPAARPTSADPSHPIGAPPRSDELSDDASSRASVEEVRLYPEAAHFYIPSLDGIRAVAFLLVFIGHAGWGHLVPGGLGVTVFFFLSGYLITTLMRREAERTGSISLRLFYLRRLLRIFPPYYLVLAITTTAYLIVSPTPHAGMATLAQLVQVSNYYLVYGHPEAITLGMHITWSLSVEEHFYLLFPLIYLVLRRWCSVRSQVAVLATLCGLVLAWRCVLVYGLHATEQRVYVATDTRVDSILFGCLLAVVGNPMLDRPRGERSRDRLDWVLVPVGLLLVVATLVFRDPRFRETFRYSIQGLALVPLFSAAIRHPGSWLFRPLNIGFLRFLGVLSYSLYLVHFNVLILVGRLDWSKGITAAVALAISFVLSWAIYQAIERPAARLRRKLCRS